MCFGYVGSSIHTGHRCHNSVSHLLCPYFIYIRDINSDGNAIAPTIAIGNRDSEGVGSLGFIIKCRFCLQLPGCADDTKRGRIRTAETISECIIIRICSDDCCANICAGCCIFCDSERRTTTIGEHRCPILIDIGDIDCDNDYIYEIPAISNADRQIGVRPLRFIVESGSGFQLSCIGVNTKRAPIATTQRIGQRIPMIRICGSEGSTDICAGCRVLRYSERRVGTLGEHRCLVYVSGIDYDINRVVATIAIGNGDDKRIRYPRFMVKYRFRL